MIGLKLKELYGSNDEFYGEWIECYSSSRYEELTNWNIELVEKYCQNISAEEKEHLKTIFINCSIYEYKFWDMSYKGSF